MDVAGTPWDVILTSRASSLYAPINRGRWETTLLLCALAMAAAGGFAFLVALAKARVRAAAAAATQGAQATMLGSIIANNQSLISVKDLNGRYLLTNGAFERAFAVDESDLIGQTDDYLDPDRATAWRANDLRARSSVLAVDEYADGVDGLRIYESLKFPLSDTAGTVYATCGVSLDVTDRRSYVEATEKSRDAALVAATTQRNVAASASHELRSPTTSIIGYLGEVLEEGHLSERDQRLLGIVHRNANRLNNLIDDLLVLGQVEGGETVTFPGGMACAATIGGSWGT